MTQVQTHGFQFQNWVRKTFFEEFEDSYTEKWDVPAMFNTRSIVPEELRALPVSVKTVKQGSPIAFAEMKNLY
jgi:hypothetical protein